MEYQQDDELESIAGELLEAEEDAADLVKPTGEQMASARHAERHDMVQGRESPGHGVAAPRREKE